MDFQRLGENHYGKVKDLLKSRSGHIIIEDAQPTLRSVLPENANGRHLLKALYAMVCDGNFVSDNSHYNSDKGKLKCHRFEIVFPSHICPPIMILCAASKHQPGNGWILGYKAYGKYSDNLKMSYIADFFKRFLKVPLVETRKEDQERFELSALLLFEITRRMPLGKDNPFSLEVHDIYYDVPVAAAIQMAMRMEDLKFSELVKVFSGKKRMEACEKISNEYFRLKSKFRTTTDKKDHLEKLVKKLLEDDDDVDHHGDREKDRKAKNSDVDDAMKELKKMDIQGSSTKEDEKETQSKSSSSNKKQRTKKK